MNKNELLIYFYMLMRDCELVDISTQFERTVHIAWLFDNELSRL